MHSVFAVDCLPISPMSLSSGLTSDLQESPSKENHDYTLEFDAERIAKMLSASDKGPPDALVSSAYEAVERGVSPVWPTVNTEGERAWYAPLAVFLNNCVDACHGVLDNLPGSAERGSRFYNHLKFIVHDKPMLEGVEGVLPVEPDIVGGLDLVPDERVAWSRGNTSTNQVLIPVEIEASWPPVVTQATTSARCLFSASPSRQFSVVLGFRHTSAQLRFLVFHRSGLTGSKPCSIKDPQGQKDILQIFLSILEWTSANDAGLLEFFDDFEMPLLRHEGDKTGTVARVTEVLHDGPCVQGRGSRVLLMDYPTGEGKESEPYIPTLNPNFCTRKRVKAGAQKKQGDNEIRMSSRLCLHTSGALTYEQKNRT